MRSATCSVLTLLALTIASHAQSLNPADILRKSDSACRLVRTARYSAKAYGGPKGSPDWTRAGNVILQRLDVEDEVGAKVRIELDNGTVYAYDGTTLNLLQPLKHSLLVAGSDEHGADLITGNVVGHLKSPAFAEDSIYAKRLIEATRTTYDGVQQVGNAQCYVVVLRLLDDELVSNVTQELYVGVEDYLPRRSVIQYTFAAKVRQEGLEIHDLTANTELPDSAFLLALPDGFQREQYHREKRPDLLATGTAAPDWTLVNGSGIHISLADLRGKVLLLDFWYTTCGPCIKAMPMVQKLHERFKKQGVVVYGVNPWQQDSADAILLMKRKGFTYGLLLHGDSVSSAYHVTAYPTLYIIGVDGTIVHRQVGYSETMDEELGRVLDGYLHEHGM